MSVFLSRLPPPPRKAARRLRQTRPEGTAQVKAKGLLRKCTSQQVIKQMNKTVLLLKHPIMHEHLLQVAMRSRRHSAGKRSLSHLSSLFVFFHCFLTLLSPPSTVEGGRVLHLVSSHDFLDVVDSGHVSSNSQTSSFDALFCGGTS